MPVAGATVQFFPKYRSGDVVSGFEAIVASKDDGAIQVAVPPGKGYLMVMGPTLDYVPKEIGGGKLFGTGKGGGRRLPCPRHPRIRREGWRRSARAHREAPQGHDNPRPRAWTGETGRRGRGDPHQATTGSPQPQLARPRFRPCPCRPLPATWIRPGAKLAGLLPRR